MADETVSKICVELGSIACQRGDYSLTYMLYNRRFAEHGSEDNLALAGSLQKIGQCYAERGRYKQAGKFLKKALAIYRETTPVNQGILRDVLDQLADLSYKQGNFSSASQYYERAMQIEEGLEHRDQEKIDNRLNQMAWLQLRQGKIEEARKIHGQAAKIQT